MSDLELLQAIEALAREISIRPISKWYMWIKELINALRRVAIEQNRTPRLNDLSDEDVFDYSVLRPLVRIAKEEIFSDDYIDSVEQIV